MGSGHDGGRDPQAVSRGLTGGPGDLEDPQDAQAPGEYEEQQLQVASRRLAPDTRWLHVVGSAHGAVPGHPAGGTRVWHWAERLASTATMRSASASSAAGIPLLTSSWSK